MGCPCREIRQVISHIPGARHFLNLLPDLPNEGRSDMEMKTQPGRSIYTTSGNGYHADKNGIIHNVLAEDADDLRRAGATDVPATVGDPTPQKPSPPAEHPPTPSPKPTVAAAPAKNEPSTP
jgi:hypothetical protein